MKPKGFLLAAGVIACVAVTSILISGASAKRTAIAPIPAFSATQLSSTPTNDWVGVHGNLMNQQFSGLTNITSSNVKGLKIAWHSQVFIPTKGKPSFTGSLAEAEPVEFNGTMYMPDAKGNVYALDATTGERLWYYKYKTPKGFTSLLQTSRGVAIGQGMVFMAQTDGQVVALDQATGRPKWDTTVGNWKTGVTFTSAPIYVDGKVIAGESGGDSGARCQLVAMSAKTGKVLWRFDVIPRGNQFGAKTWSKGDYPGGGAMWSPPAVDTKLGLVYVAIGNPVPYNGADRGRGKDLFSESTVAVHLNNGKLAWYYQETHHDNWDYDPAANGVELFDLNVNGVMRHGIAQANKTGWVYILDRKTGKPLYGIPEKKMPQNASQHTWPTQPIPNGQPFATQCAPKAAWKAYKQPDGKPTTVGCLYTPYDNTHFTAVAPSALGGADWPPTAYSPKTGYLYICSKNSTAAYKALPPAKPGQLKPLGNFFQLDGVFAGKGSPATKAQGTVVAVNMRNNRVVWTVKFSGDQDPCYSGVLATQGGLVFVGRNNGTLQAYSDTSGKLLWTSPKLAAGVNAAPITYTANGKQYVAVYAGGNGLLGETGYLSPKSGSDLYAFQLP